MNARAIALAGVMALVMFVGVAVVWLLTQRPPSPGTTPVVTAVLVGAGDIAGCEGRSDTATAKLLDRLPGTVFTLGDNAYPDGTAEQFAQCYEPTWGKHRDRTRPAVGNH